ncbi:MAG TPA: polysaccharide pyruvyl transferase family protein [Actinomycetota bacterium]|nr:polysaccharide pyruvyl transferase family protein [Actinomycetota bacterium]
MRLGLWGTFDLENFGDMLYPRIVRRELARRDPGIEVVPFSPIGYVGHNRFEEPGETPAAPLGTWSAGRLAELAEQIDVLAIGGGDIVHDRDAGLASHYGLEPDELHRRRTHRFFCEGLAGHGVPSAWFAVGVPFEPDVGLAERLRNAESSFSFLSVRDEGSKERLRAAGIEADIDVVPDPAFLVSRLVSAEEIAGRIERLRDGGSFPRGRRALLIQGTQPLRRSVDAIAEQVTAIVREHEMEPVLVETGPLHGDDEFADALEARLPEPRRLPADAGSDDLIAAIASCAAFIGSSLHGNIVAAAFDRTWLMLDLVEQTKRRGVAALLDAEDRVVPDAAGIADAFRAAAAQGSLAPRVAHLHERIDGAFDRLAELATSAPSRARQTNRVEDAADVRLLPDAAERAVVAQSLFADERDRRLLYEREVADVMARTAKIEAWNLELDAGNVERDHRIEELDADARALRDRLDHVRFRDWLRSTAPGRAFRRRRDSP